MVGYITRVTSYILRRGVQECGVISKIQTLIKSDQSWLEFWQVLKKLLKFR